MAEPLQDLKEGMDQLEKNKTLRYILTTLLAIGNFLNSTEVSGSEDVNDSALPPAPPPPPHTQTHFFSFTLFPPTLLLLLPCQQMVLVGTTEATVYQNVLTLSFHSGRAHQGLLSLAPHPSGGNVRFCVVPLKGFVFASGPRTRCSLFTGLWSVSA